MDNKESIYTLIKDLEWAIACYKEAILQGENYTDPFKYESFLWKRGLERGLCFFIKRGRPSMDRSWIDKYTKDVPLHEEDEYMFRPTDPESMTINQMQFCLRVRLEALKWELGLQKIKLQAYEEV